mmetsp:Transcript_19746/g.28969  ORF Transcript_19746/g.28969 Transcript_19746/m.28969 type:complete len:190 (+) Transcript_19746:47-616(+)
MVRFASLAILATSLVASTSAYTAGNNNGRRTFVQNIATATAGVAFLGTTSEAAFALESCPADSKNCVRTSWTPPADTSKSDVIAAVRGVINAYPQEGQAEVDGGGWSIAVDELDGAGTARVEYRSSGKGFFAKAFNGGKPFVDDLKVEIQDSGVVQVKSQSRIGESDFGVNAKRVDYLKAKLAAKGWKV